MKHATRIAAVLAIAVSLPACVTTGRYKMALELQKAQDEVKFQQLVGQANTVISPLRERLIRLGHLDKDGNLKPLPKGQ